MKITVTGIACVSRTRLAGVGKAPLCLEVNPKKIRAFGAKCLPIYEPCPQDIKS